MSRSKIFGIGLNKTGTRSVAAAVRILGWRTLHKGDGVTSALVDQAIDDGLDPLSLLPAEYDAYFDVESIVRRFDVLDRAHPGSRFILTTCDEDRWIESRRRHVEANRRQASADPAGQWLEIDPDRWRADRRAHHEAVHAFFRGRDDLLVFDVRAGDGWDELTSFLGRPVPRRAFPWENEAGRGTYRPGSIASALRRRLDGARSRARRTPQPPSSTASR